jgi:uncharacterized RDD family membrane protein YckC
VDIIWTGVPLALLVLTPLLVALAARTARRNPAIGNTAIVGRRAAAHVLDWVFVLGVILAADWIAVRWAIALDLGSVSMSWNGPGIWALFFLDFVVLQGLTGYTLGKWLLRIRTVRAAGQLPGLLAALLRSVPLMIEWIGLVALWAMLRHPNHQRIGDRWAHTYVVPDGRPWPSFAHRTRRAAKQQPAA